ncbi:uncharacterized protein LOC110467223 [Mizuhopecten yessoensis]|uniref:Uncharacterized protein n=1 Tax=Mizuhopecten yessoensis TaxID=6573 RepID=A0A210PMB2_MIZYE|nr:uncharacterized protein LOC110467223 [Mizuhopecten yessoensis]OWF37611.1 hypothetical protein KP79_PYT10420 [Mizuhopecten yessoensis]
MGCQLGSEVQNSNFETSPRQEQKVKEINREVIPVFLREQSTHMHVEKTQFLHTHNIQSLCATDDGVWIASSDSTELVEMDNDGERVRSVEMVSGIEGISVSPLSGRLWMCCDDSTIREMTLPESADSPPEPAQIRFETGCMCICVTYNEYIVIGTYMDVTIYSQDGEVILSSQNVPGSHIVKPYKIAACKKTRRIAVADWDDAVCGGEDNPNVAVFNDRLEFLHRYNGVTKLLKKRKSETTRFLPYDLCFDPQGLLLVVDYKIRCINVIDTEGRFLRLLLALPSSTMSPICLSFHDNQLWVGCSDKSLKVYKYEDLAEN